MQIKMGNWTKVHKNIHFVAVLGISKERDGSLVAVDLVLFSKAWLFTT